MPAETPPPPLRVRQIRITGAALSYLARLPLAGHLIGYIRIIPALSAIYRYAVGYQRPFRTLSEADAAVSVYAGQGHANPSNVDLHLDLNKSARPSDYAALFHLQRLLPEIRRLFDLGGNVGNLYYCYSAYLDFPAMFIWQVQDLQENMDRGRALAIERNADQISFVNEWSEASGADLLLVSGSLHYMRETMADMLSKLDHPPEYILINRTPITDSKPFATIQDAGSFRVACMVHNRQELLQELESAGYQLEDSWQATELALRIPADPDHTVPSYSGLLLRRKRSLAANSQTGGPQV